MRRRTSRSPSSGVIKTCRRRFRDFSRGERVSSQRMSARTQAISALPLSLKKCAPDAARSRCPLSPAIQPTTASTLDSARGEPVSIQSRTLKAPAPASLGSSVTTRWPMRARALCTIGPISREGSSTTAAPVQVSIVGTPTEVVLKPPEPATTSAWVDPERQGSINSGAVPPCPQEREDSARSVIFCTLHWTYHEHWLYFPSGRQFL